MHRFSISSTALAACALAGLPLATAHARIACDGNYQVVQGNLIATPYCQEHNLARVAQAYGMRVSFDAIRSSDSVKGQVCRTIGHDMRVRETCLLFRNEGGPVDRR
jgi:hypothetical protein